MRPARTTKKANPVSSSKGATTASSQGRRDPGAVVSKSANLATRARPTFAPSLAPADRLARFVFRPSTPIRTLAHYQQTTMYHTQSR